MIALALIGCRPTDPLPRRPRPEPAVSACPDPRIGPVRYWDLVEAAPEPVTLTVEGGGERWTVTDPPAPEHHVALVGLLPSTVYRVHARVGDRPVDPVAFRTEEPPDRPWWPHLDPLAFDPDRVEPGWTLLPVSAPGFQAGAVLILDDQLRVRWWLLSDETTLWGVEPDGAGGLWINEDRTVRHETLGGITLLYDADPAYRDPHETLPDGEGGWWTFRYRWIDQQVPADYGAEALVERAVEDDLVVHRAPDGSERSAWSTAALLDPGHAGYGALQTLDTSGLDFVHANAIVPLADGGALVALRNQDLVVNVDDRGQARWMLGDPSGWHPPWTELLLTPTARTTWPYHAHGPAWDEDTGRLLIFDNRLVDHTPYEPDPAEPSFSRVVEYAVDAEAGTVDQVRSLDQTTTGPLWAKIMGAARRLPATGDLLGVYGWLEEEQGVPNGDRGRGEISARLVEWDPDAPDAPVLDLSVWTDAADAPGGIWVYRAARGLPPLHEP